MPLLSDTMTEGKIVQWNKKVGDKVKSDDNLADVETDKATMEVVGYAEGTLLYIGVKEGEAAKVNSVIAIVGKEGTDVSGLLIFNLDAAARNTGCTKLRCSWPVVSGSARSCSSNSSCRYQQLLENGRIKASPLAKKLAEDKGIDIKQVVGSGDGGRIIKRDVDSFVPAAPCSCCTVSCCSQQRKTACIHARWTGRLYRYAQFTDA